MPRPFRWDLLSEEQRLLLSVLVRCHGQANAKPVPELANLAGLSPRRAQDVVKELIEEWGIPIGSAYVPPHAGWYVCATEPERRENYDALGRRALSILKRRKAFNPRHNTVLNVIFAGQLPLPLGGFGG